jgi:hypothetical protein
METLQLERMEFNAKSLGFFYALGDAAYVGDWDRYWRLHAQLRKQCWPWYGRVIFRLAAVVQYLKGGKWKP